jgi:hypothetical protein
MQTNQNPGINPEQLEDVLVRFFNWQKRLLAF